MPTLAPALRADLSTFAGHRRILVALDFDGTLSPLVDLPQDARPNPEAATAVEQLLTKSGVYTAVVSGRNLDSLIQVYPAPRPEILIGSHGAERHLPARLAASTEHLELTETQRLNLAKITSRLTYVADRYEHVNIELKPSATVLHVRQASAEDATAALTEAQLALEELDGIRLMSGKAVLEASVHSGNKGQALQWLRTVLKVDAVLFVGDDVTDEDGFRILGPEDLGIKVGPGKTMAQHRLASTEQMAELLDFVISMRD